MAKEAKKTTPKTKEQKKVRSVKPKRLVRKTAPKKAKTVKVAKPVVKSNRKFNSNPVLAKTTGINISPAKVKNIVSNHVLNKDAHHALTELKNARARTIVKVVDGVEVKEEFAGTPISQLSDATQTYIKFAYDEYESSQRDEYAKAKVSGMSVVDKKRYQEARSKAKSEFDSKSGEQFLSDGSEFNLTEFNRKYDVNFYAEYDRLKEVADKADKADLWKKAMDKVTKLKNRFSTNSRVFLSAFVEYLIKQLALNGTVCCIAEKKKIIQLSHILNTTHEGFEERFPLYPLIVNLDTFKQAQKYLSDSSAFEPPEDTKDAESDSAGAEEASDSKDGEPEEKSKKKKKHEKNTDIFTLDGISLDKQYQFRYYISESCRETRMDLAKTARDEDGELMEVYNYTSVSKLFKNFCSTLVCEFLVRIGKMLEKEIETRGIKTVNDTIIGAVISHYHIVCGVDEAKTLDFIRTVTTKYYSYVADRQKNRKSEKGNENANKGDLPYVDK